MIKAFERAGRITLHACMGGCGHTYINPITKYSSCGPTELHGHKGTSPIHSIGHNDSSDITYIDWINKHNV